jgi:hypothetical protein
VQRFVSTLDPGDTSCTQHIAEVHLVPNFVHTSQELDPATPVAGNQGTGADLRVAAAAAYAVGDVLARWWVNLTGDGVGFLGGSFSYAAPANITYFTLDNVNWVDDVQVSGKMNWDYNYPGGVIARVRVDGGANESGSLSFTWNSHTPLAYVAITGKIGSRAIVATMYAP